jgi:hypothetical protein
MDTKLSRTIVAQFYALKCIKMDTKESVTKGIKFMESNQEYFKGYDLEDLKFRYNITQKDLDDCIEPKIADLDTEEKELQRIKDQAKELHLARINGSKR